MDDTKFVYPRDLFVNIIYKSVLKNVNEKKYIFNINDFDEITTSKTVLKIVFS